MAQYANNNDANSPVHVNDPRVSQAQPSALVGGNLPPTGAGNVRVTQIAVETSIAPTDSTIRVTQIAVETSIAIVQVYQLNTWEQDTEYQVRLPWINPGFLLEQESNVFPVAAPAVHRQPRIKIST